ncbi:hypothetical protein [Ferruginibacter albus]|uniref:hypothetical protein n=1 Tax=Ferruginibacter albus TaxID=2875540 RepID=UPI001CC39BBB|nr:hypothetical protein [Ferruginibacter albus]UAY53196.1 hypothetical protein K9M53_05870 [Ferruginibacter albus]
MKVENAEFNITIDGKQYTASAHKFKMQNYPQIHVVLDASDKKSYPFNFYEIEPQNFFWFEIPDKKQLIAKAIANRLKKVNFN